MIRHPAVERVAAYGITCEHLDAEQELALAVVLAAQPPVLLLDEPTRGLDYPAKQRLVGTLRELAADGHCVILATHDVELAAEVATRVVVLAEGETPRIVGWTLDLAGGMSPMAWGLAFLAVAVLMLIALAAFLMMRPANLAGEHGR